MLTISKEFWLPKRGSTEAEYEDAFHSAKDKTRFAVADGASESSFCREWAKQLVRGFTKKQLSIPIRLEELKFLQEKWAMFVHRKPLPWFAEEQASNGAFAAFVGIEFTGEQFGTSNQKIWRATGAGDSCIVQVRGDEVIHSFPLAESDSFNSRPNILSSVPAMNRDTSGLVLSASGSYGCDDIFFLMTDALACWFFKEREQGNRPWRILRDLDTQKQVSFCELINDLRSSGRIKNDDVTLLRVDAIS